MVSERVRTSYGRLRRRITIFFTLWFIAILLAVTLIISSFFIFNNPVLKSWALLLIFLMFVKIAYDIASDIRAKYEQFKKETGKTDEQLNQILQSQSASTEAQKQQTSKQDETPKQESNTT